METGPLLIRIKHSEPSRIVSVLTHTKPGLNFCLLNQPLLQHLI